MSRFTTSALLAFTVVAVGCGGTCPGAADATSAPASAEAPKPAEEPETTPKETESTAEAGGEGASAESGESARTDAPAAAEKTETKSTDAGPEPTFPEHASVAQAIAAIPKGTPRANLDPEALGAPLQNAALYEPCKVGGQHFKLHVAVWNGHAVGIDVTTSNKKLAECVRSQVETIQWRDKVRSLNTVEYSM
jgi:hypothetical protein